MTALKLVLAEGSFHYVIFFQLKCSFHRKYCPAKIFGSIFSNFVSIPGHFGIFLSSRCVMAVKSRSKEMWLSWSFLQPSISFNFLFCFFMESTPSQIIVLPYNGLSHSCSLKKTLEKPLRNPLISSVCKFFMFGIYLISRDQYPFYIIKDLQKDFYVQSNVHLDCKYNMNFVFTQYLISTTVCVETWYSIGDNQTFPL